MPDANDGDVGIFPFMKRHLARNGGAKSEAEIYVKAKQAWRTVTPKVGKAVRAQVLRKTKKVVQLKGGNWYGGSCT